MEAAAKKGFSLSASAVKRGGEQAAGAAAPKIPKVRETSEGRRFFYSSSTCPLTLPALLVPSAG